MKHVWQDFVRTVLGERNCINTKYFILLRRSLEVQSKGYLLEFNQLCLRYKPNFTSFHLVVDFKMSLHQNKRNSTVKTDLHNTSFH